MISSLFSFLLPSGGSAEDVEDRFSSVYSFASDDSSMSITREGLDNDRPNSLDIPQNSFCSSAPQYVQIPEGAHTLERSVSDPPVLRRPSVISLSPRPYQRPKHSKSSQSLALQQLPPLKPLSPIYEPINLSHDERSGEIVTSQVCVQPSPSSLRERIAGQGYHQHFITRTLKRSISQKSSSSLRSVASGAPKLPPLNLRPHFNQTASTITPPVLSSPSSHSPSSAQSYFVTPQSVTFPTSSKFGFLEHLQKSSAIYGDESSEGTGSFMTAPSNPRHSAVSKSDIPCARLAAGYDLQVQHQLDVDQPTRQDEEFVAKANLTGYNAHFGSNRASKSIYSATSTTVEDRSNDGAEDVRENGDVESFVMRRWDKAVLLYRKDPNEFIQAKNRAPSHSKLALVLFWLGFVAPWCWLIGGWLLPKKEAKRAEERTYSDQNEMEAAEEGSATKKNQEYLKRFVAPHRAAYLREPTNFVSESNADTPHLKGPNLNLDVWVSRCRIAALGGGIFLVFLLLVVLPAMIVT